MPRRFMFFIVSMLIYGVGRAIGWLTLSVTMGREALFEETTGRDRLSVLWIVASMVISGIICFGLTQWGFGLPQ